MLNFQDILNSVWISKQKTYILGLETKHSSLKQVLYHIEKKKTQSIIFKDNNLYKSGSKTPLNDPKEHEAFVKRMHQIFDNNPYWSTITTAKYDDKKLSTALKQYLVPDTVRQKIAKFAQKICKANTFDTHPFYKHQATSTQIKDQILASMSNKSGTKKANAPPKSSTSVVPLDTLQKQASSGTSVKQSTTKEAQNSTADQTFDFSEFKAACIALINDVGEGRPMLKITSDNQTLDYTYTATIKKDGIVFLKISGYQKQELALKFDEGNLYINSQKSNQSNDLFMTYFNQIISDLDSNKAILEAVDTT